MATQTVAVVFFGGWTGMNTIIDFLEITGMPCNALEILDPRKAYEILCRRIAEQKAPSLLVFLSDTPDGDTKLANALTVFKNDPRTRNIQCIVGCSDASEEPDDEDEGDEDDEIRNAQDKLSYYATTGKMN